MMMRRLNITRQKDITEDSQEPSLSQEDIGSPCTPIDAPLFNKHVQPVLCPPTPTKTPFSINNSGGRKKKKSSIGNVATPLFQDATRLQQLRNNDDFDFDSTRSPRLSMGYSSVALGGQQPTLTTTSSSSASSSSTKRKYANMQARLQVTPGSAEEEQQATPFKPVQKSRKLFFGATPDGSAATLPAALDLSGGMDNDEVDTSSIHNQSTQSIGGFATSPTLFSFPLDHRNHRVSHHHHTAGEPQTRVASPSMLKMQQLSQQMDDSQEQNDDVGNFNDDYSGASPTSRHHLNVQHHQQPQPSLTPKVNKRSTLPSSSNSSSAIPVSSDIHGSNSSTSSTGMTSDFGFLTTRDELALPSITIQPPQSRNDVLSEYRHRQQPQPQHYVTLDNDEDMTDIHSDVVVLPKHLGATPPSMKRSKRRITAPIPDLSGDVGSPELFTENRFAGSIDNSRYFSSDEDEDEEDENEDEDEDDTEFKLDSVHGGMRIDCMDELECDLASQCQRPISPLQFTQTQSAHDDEKAPVGLAVQLHENPFSPDRNASRRKSSKNDGRENHLNTGNTPHASRLLYKLMHNNKLDELPHEMQERIIQNIYFSRYLTEFEEIHELGKGSFGRVCKCKNKFDGCMYAVKQTKNIIRSEAHKIVILREVQAQAQLTDNPYIVRYFSAWIEDAHLFMQLELCGNGNMASSVMDRRPMEEGELLELLRQVTTGLHHMHSSNLVHLDVKPENLYCTSNKDGSNKRYKIGDLGLVTSSLQDKYIVNEGDSRYLAPELLENDLIDYKRAMTLSKVDIFSLGATIYELALGEPLPTNGAEWHSIRNGQLKKLPRLSLALIDLIKSMLRRDPSERPDACDILHHELVQSRQLSPEDMEARIITLERLLQNQQRMHQNTINELNSLKMRVQSVDTDNSQAFAESLSLN